MQPVTWNVSFTVGLTASEAETGNDAKFKVSNE
jgi:hypothetical protein